MPVFTLFKGKSKILFPLIFPTTIPVIRDLKSRAGPEPGTDLGLCSTILNTNICYSVSFQRTAIKMCHGALATDLICVFVARKSESQGLAGWFLLRVLRENNFLNSGFYTNSYMLHVFPTFPSH